jgi:acetyl-CoA carboxylase carboxyl transferase subunit alpha
MPDTLEFEEPIAVLLKEIDALNMLPQTDTRDGEISGLRSRIDQIRGELYRRLTPWQRVTVARHANRPYMLDYVERLCTEFTELHGDRRFADDGAIVCGFARFKGRPLLVIGHQKGRDTKQKVHRNFGYARPEGYRKAMRTMKLAEKFNRPILVFVDTPAAYPGIESEERGIAEAIAYNLREMAVLRVPIIVVVTGEGGSGGALGLAIGDRVFMQEFAVYSVIPPEGCAAILWRDAGRKVEAADALKITAPDLLSREIIDGIIPEPLGGADKDPDEAARLLSPTLEAALEEVSLLTDEDRMQQRYQKFRNMGRLGIEFVDLDAVKKDGGSASGSSSSSGGGSGGRKRGES